MIKCACDKATLEGFSDARHMRIREVLKLSERLRCCIGATSAFDEYLGIIKKRCKMPIFGCPSNQSLVSAVCASETDTHIAHYSIAAMSPRLA